MTSQAVSVTAPVPNQPPVAAFSFTTDDLGVSVDGTASDDPDGNVVLYEWDFGDGSNGLGADHR